MRADLAGLKCVCDEIARAIQSAESSAIFLLIGDIGAGKTTLVREFAKQVGIKESVTSPTFSLLHIYNAGNSVLGMQFRTCENFQASTDLSLVESPKISTNTKATPQFLEFASEAKQPSLPLRFCESQNLVENSTKFAESSLDSAVNCHESANADSRNDEFILDSTNPTHEANSTIADEFLGFCEASDKDKTKVYRGSEPKQSLKSRCESKFATTIYHYDLYQKGVDYAIELGLLDLLSENGIHFVEWGDRRLFEIIKDAFDNIFILQITKAKNDRIYELKREF